jgi:peptide/nickel transport system substrate-binding protein
VDSVDVVRSHWARVGIQTTVKPLNADVWWPRMYSSEYQAAGYVLGRRGWATFPRDYAAVDRTTYWGTRFGLYYASLGRDGEAPSGDVKRAVELYDMVKGEPDAARKRKEQNEILLLGAQGVWSTPIVGAYIQPVIVRNSLRNVPARAVNAWPLRSPGYTNPEQYFFKK